MAATEGIKQPQSTWSPYDNNGGTCIAIAGADYCVIAADTRMSTSDSILTRDYSKICILSDKCVMASSGFQADVKALQKNLSARHLIYQHKHNKQMSCPAMAQLLSNTLYYKRFFPYYSFNVLGGLDNEGKGCVFTYDAFGSNERVGYGAQGTGGKLMMPVLDNQLKSANPLLLPAQSLNSVSVGPWGRKWESQFYKQDTWDDGMHSGIHQIKIVHGLNHIHSIDIEYEDCGSRFWSKHNWSKQYEESGGYQTRMIRLNYPTEILTSISGHYGTSIDSLTFKTSFLNEYGPYGRRSGYGKYFSIANAKIVGFHGWSHGWRQEKYLRGIGVHLLKIHTSLHTSLPPKPISVGPWGSKDPWGCKVGDMWDDSMHSGIRQVIVSYDEYSICSIKIEYDNNGSPSWSEVHGGSGGNRIEKIQLNYPTEFLTSISGCYETVGLRSLTSLNFESNNSKKWCTKATEHGYIFSHSSKTNFSIPVINGEIVAFHGRCDDRLLGIGVYLSNLHTAVPPKDATTPLSKLEAVDLVKDVFASAAERDIYTGDRLEIVVVNAKGVERNFLELRRD